jgi:multidrug efflux pump subunit AcrA (membrane-fusion protein)
VLLRFTTLGKPVLLGMNGSIEIEVETIGNAVTMPVEALLEDANADYVYTVRDGRAQRTEIEIGRLTDTRVEILSGLSEGDEVIVSGVSQLADGDRVRAE